MKSIFIEKVKSSYARNSDNYKKEYRLGLVDKWDELINWKKREKGEGHFFIDLLKKAGAKRVLDVSTGTGFHSISLINAGFDILSVDGSREMLAKAKENASKRGCKLDTVVVDWRLLSEKVDSEFDAIICLGNSFTYLFDDKERRKVLTEFYKVLKPGGSLIIDHRNYDAMLDLGYNSKHKYYYCGTNVDVRPEYIDEELTRFKYTFPDKSVYYTNMFPFRKQYIKHLILEMGFIDIRTYGDFKEKFPENEIEFFVHICKKNKLNTKSKRFYHEFN